MSKKYMIAGNWKMNNSISETDDLIQSIKENLSEENPTKIIISPSFLSLQHAVIETENTNISISSQNIHWEENGAFTGEVSGKMLNEIGVNYAIIGHSERRQYFGETDLTINKRVKSALKCSITPIICIGETLEERESNQALSVIKNQFNIAVQSLSESELEKCVIAYEPVWAIGTGKTASPEQAQDVHKFIRTLFPESISEKIIILYGGSMKPENAESLMLQPDINGGLIGGASLKADQFISLIKTANSLV